MSALHGSPMTFDDVKALGERILKLERDFNLKAGFTKADDRLPDFMIEEKIPPHTDGDQINIFTPIGVG